MPSAYVYFYEETDIGQNAKCKKKTKHLSGLWGRVTHVGFNESTTCAISMRSENKTQIMAERNFKMLQA